MKKEADETLAKLKDIGKHDYVSPLDLAIIYAGMGDKGKAFEWLERALQERSFWLVYIRWEPQLDPLRSDPRFQEVLRRIGLPTGPRHAASNFWKDLSRPTTDWTRPT